MGGMKSAFQIISTRRTIPKPKPLVEGCPRLDVRWLSRQGFLRPLGVSHRVTLGHVSLDLIAERGSVILSYDVGHPPVADRNHVEQRVQLNRTACNYGGTRTWFLCPAEGCGRRCAVLYCRERGFACRRCNGLVYQTQREHRSGRGFLKYERIRRRLGSAFAEARRKPKWMHWRTFQRRMTEADEAYRRGLVSSLPGR
jgi:hypothetical protein